ncbi:LGFP repeat-containing protein [Microbacterium paulum]
MAVLALLGSLAVAAPANAVVDASASVAAAAPAAVDTAVDSGIVKAAAVVGFNPENIISDSLFYDGNAMTAAEIQSFLDAKIGSCRNGKCLNVLNVSVSSRDAWISQATGNLVCTALQGGTMRVSELIYRMQVACGISAKAILVTLQKEQGLTTSDAPSDWNLRAAMGASCPDTSPCDPAYSGLGPQIVQGVRQIKIYKAGRFAMQPGVNYIGYNPNSACGGTNLNIQNYATAALYNYTPYQPNAASLAAGWGLGDGCSSYGNRNFYNYYTSWFGSTTSSLETARAAITSRWAAIGGSASVLGASVSGVVCGTVGGGCYQNFQNGAISWTASTGAWETYGQIRARWQALSYETSVLAYPIGAPTCGTRDGGCYQNFQGGAISWTASTGAWETSGAIRSRWQALRFEDGVLGYPIGAPACGISGGGCYQDYQNGAVTWTPSVGAWETYGDIRARWKATGFESGVLGYPVSPVRCEMKDSGCYQDFQNGAITWTSSVGAWETYGPIRARWKAADYERGSLGLPTGAPVQSGGVSYQTFEGGAIGWSSAAGAFASTGAIGERWVAIGASLSPLGAPIGELVCGTRNGGCYQNFQNGAVSASPTTGAWETYGAIRARWQRERFEDGSLGYPTSAPQVVGGSTYQRFEGGAIGLSAGADTAYASTGAIGGRWIALGGNASILGVPRGEITCGTPNSGCYQDFQGGAISSTPSSGTWETYGVIRDRWKATGFESGVLGYPIGAPTCGTKANGCYQDYEHGAISWTEGTGAWETYGAIRQYWRSQDFERGALGYPMGAPTTDSAGSSRQRFEGGTVVVDAGSVNVVPAG